MILVLRRLQEQTAKRVGVDASPIAARTSSTSSRLSRDDLFQVDVDELYRVGTAVLGMQERRMVRVFVREDTYGRFYSVLVYLPRDRYTTTVRLAIQDILMETLHGVSVDYTTMVSESVLARLNYTVRVAPEYRDQDVDTDALQARIRAAVRSWDDEFGDALGQEVGEEQSAELATRYAPACRMPTGRRTRPARRWPTCGSGTPWPTARSQSGSTSRWTPRRASGASRSSGSPSRSPCSTCCR